MAHFVAFCIGFQKNIPLQNPPGGEGGGYMAAQGLLKIIYMEFAIFGNQNLSCLTEMVCDRT